MVSQQISTRRRKALIEKISQLTETEHQEIFKLLNDALSKNDIGFTENRNGIFLNFKHVPAEIVLQIERFVEFCNDNRQDLDEYDKRINECKLNKDISKVIQIHATNASAEDAASNDQPQSNSLHDVLHRESKNHSKKCEWIDALKECKEKERVSNYVEALEHNFQKIHKKKSCNMKYANAKKKYARKVVTDKKFDFETVSNLEIEPYILSHSNRNK